MKKMKEIDAEELLFSLKIDKITLLRPFFYHQMLLRRIVVIL